MSDQHIQKFLEEMGSVYSSLADKTSRDIFEKILLYRISKDLTNIDWVIRNYIPEFKESGIYSETVFENYLQAIREKAGDKKIIIYGAGANGKSIFEGLKGINIKAFCDRQAEYKRVEYCGLPVISMKDLIVDCQEDFIVVSAYTYADEIIGQLKHNGIKSENIFFSKDQGWGKWYSLKQYFAPELINFQNIEVFVDGGAYDGSTFREFFRQAGCCGKKVLAFEPDESGYELCRNRIITDGIKDVILYKAGLWSHKTALSFQGNTGQLSHIAPEGGDTRIECVTLDDVVNETPCLWNEDGSLKQMFIKLDVEGTELKALQGSEGVIKKYAPKLAVCIYHRPHDLIEIPAYLKRLQPNYEFYIRHYSNYLAETVLYAV